MTHKLATTTLTALATASLLAGCNLRQDDGLAEDAAASVSQAQQAAGITRLVARPLDNKQIQAPDEAAQTVQSEGIAGLYPPGCAAVSITNFDSVHVEFDDCSGPFGLAHLSGGIDAVFSIAEGKVVIDLDDSDDLTLTQHPVDYQAHAVVESIGQQVTLGWEGHWQADTANDETATHDSKLTIVSDVLTRCVTLDGTASSTIGERGLDWTVDGYAVCPITCPSGGVVTATGKKSGVTATIVFDGSASATVDIEGGASYDVPLVCVAVDA